MSSSAPRHTRGVVDGGRQDPEVRRGAATWSSPGARAPRHVLLGAWAWVSLVQYVVVLAIVRTRFEAPFDPRRNTISDLGAATCGEFAGREVCSPWHQLANASWILAGACIVAGAVLCAQVLLPRGGAGAVARALIVVSGVALVVVGLSPEDTRTVAHYVAAITAILAGQLGILLTGTLLRGASHRPGAAWSGLAWAGIVTGAAGLVLTAAYALGVVGPDVLGLVERVAVYSMMGWLFAAGVTVLVAARRSSRSQTRDDADRTS